MDKDIVIDVSNASVIFNKSSENVTGLKEYVIKLLKKELMFEEFYALKDINFQVKKGESWGLIGTNGSGKSTLLKLICGILKPSRGNVNITGNISPLIELGAGFNWDLTARENIYLNGVILGYSKKFIQEKFDEIVEFAELKDFLDMPIKNFSSGMAARLGFSIATVVKPEILIVDEVLAVGDIAFQQKCQKRMEAMLADGTTLLFVSHTADQVKELCQNAIWLDKGCVKEIGFTDSVLRSYHHYLGVVNS
ncbi:ABC transporter ATP-binding protein [Bibersteinia trehalosi]|uniref:ABC transporter ATP-binding protein n=1 Tax=Bibersteinia trehalosi TaxID=47735 RepID=UPI004045A4AC